MRTNRRIGRWTSGILTLGLVAWLTPGASAAVMNGLTDDARVRTNPATSSDPNDAFVHSTTSTTSQAGFGGSPAAFNATVLVFQLPTLAAGEYFASATLNISANKNETPAFNGDLYGLDRRASATVVGTDFFAGSNDTRAFATKLQDSILTPSLSTTMTALTTDATGSLNLLDYLNAQYDGGTGAGEFVFLRLNIDTATHENTTNRYEVGTADNATPSLRPFIEFTVIPEPASLALMGLGGLLMLSRGTSRGGRENA